MTAPFYKDNSGRSHFFPAEWKDFTDYEKEEWDKIFPSSLDRSVERIWDEEMNRWVERPNKTIEEKLGRSVSQPGKEEQLKNMLEDVVNELDLSDGMIEKHGPLGTAPAELVREVLKQKDLTIRLLKAGFKHIDPQPSQPVQGKYKQGHTFEAIQKMREISQADPKVHNEIAEHAQPPLTEQGKEEDRLTEVEWAKKSGFLAIAVRVQELEIENSRLKSKPTDGWSDEEVVKIMTDFFIWWYNRPGADTKSTAKEWLSDYKAKQLKS